MLPKIFGNYTAIFLLLRLIKPILALCTKPTTSSVSHGLAEEDIWLDCNLTQEPDLVYQGTPHYPPQSEDHNVHYSQGHELWPKVNIIKENEYYSSNPSDTFKHDSSLYSDEGGLELHGVVHPLDGISLSPCDSTCYLLEEKFNLPSDHQILNKGNVFDHHPSSYFDQQTKFGHPTEDIGTTLDIIDTPQEYHCSQTHSFKVSHLPNINGLTQEPNLLNHQSQYYPQLSQEYNTQYPQVHGFVHNEGIIPETLAGGPLAKTNFGEQLGEVGIHHPSYEFQNNNEHIHEFLPEINEFIHIMEPTAFASNHNFTPHMSQGSLCHPHKYQILSESNSMTNPQISSFGHSSPFGNLEQESSPSSRFAETHPGHSSFFEAALQNINGPPVNFEKSCNSQETPLNHDEDNLSRWTNTDHHQMQSNQEHSQSKNQHQIKRVSYNMYPGINGPWRKEKSTQTEPTSDIEESILGKKRPFQVIESEHMQQDTQSSQTPFDVSEANGSQTIDALLRRTREVKHPEKLKVIGIENRLGLSKEHSKYSGTQNKIQEDMSEDLMLDDDINTSRKVLHLLKEIGSFTVNNSLTISYETSHWFQNLKNQMIGNSPGNQSWIKQVSLATKYAHSYVTMTFLALLSLYEPPAYDQYSVDQVLRDGWEFIKSHFGRWNKMRFEDKEFQELLADIKSYKPSDWLDPHILFKYLFNLSTVSCMTGEILISIVSEWRKLRENSKTPTYKLGYLKPKIMFHYHPNSISLLGGYFSRGAIKNPQFEGMNERIFPSGHLRAMECIRLGKSANFMSQQGFGLCQEVHNFFLSLIQTMLKNYRDGHQCDLYTNESIPWHEAPMQCKCEEKHALNVEKIVKAISVAEYKVTVGFIGIVKELYQEELTTDQLELLISSAWQFLKHQFSEWKEFNFENKNLQMYFSTSRLSPQSQVYWSGSENIFQGLWAHPSGTPSMIPITCLTILLKSWYRVISEPDFVQMIGPGFKDKYLSKGTCLSWIKKP